MRLRSFVLAATIAALTGCGSAASDTTSNGGSVMAAPDSAPENIQDARELWDRSAVGSYSVTAQMTCYCPQDLVQPIRLGVEGGAVLSSEGLELPLKNLSDKGAQRLTIEGLFQFIEDAKQRDAHILEVTYDSQYGFPTRINYDGHPMIADDERQYRLTDFEPGALR